jgi:hypothetical protein
MLSSTTRILRSSMARRQPRRFVDMVPSGLGPLTMASGPLPVTAPSDSVPVPKRRRINPKEAHTILTTKPNQFGLYRVYEAPTQNHIPDPDDTNDTRAQSANRPPNDPKQFTKLVRQTILPYPNISAFKFNYWWWIKDGRSQSDRQYLLNDIFAKGEFKLEDLTGVNMADLDDQMVTMDRQGADNGWITHAVDIKIPPGKLTQRTQELPKYTIKGLRYRRLTEVIKMAFARDNARWFHYDPFKQYWQPNHTLPPVRVYDELYTSDAWIDEHRRLQESPTVDGCTLPRVIAGMMLWSNATQCSQFGDSSLWPIYCFPGNLSKYERASPKARAGIHVAYIPKVCMIPFFMKI